MQMNVPYGAMAIVLMVAQLTAPPPASGAQDNRQAGGAQQRTGAAFDARDLSGFWDMSEGSRGISRLPGQDMPPMTPLGQKQFESNKPSYGPRAVPPSLGNDAVGECNPQGMPRILLFPRPVEFVMLPNRMFQVFQWHRVLREIWIDGRSLPADFNPDFRRWYGYSAARWEGDTLVVESAGFDDRAWLDHFGYPKSDQMRLEERYTRTGPDTIQVNMTVRDPKMYARPWVAETKIFTRVPRQETISEGWLGLMEEICVPLDELEFNRRVRDTAAGVQR
jgi:hypothetical protein